MGEGWKLSVLCALVGVASLARMMWLLRRTPLQRVTVESRDGEVHVWRHRSRRVYAFAIACIAASFAIAASSRIFGFAPAFVGCIAWLLDRLAPAQSRVVAERAFGELRLVGAEGLRRFRVDDVRAVRAREANRHVVVDVDTDDGARSEIDLGAHGHVSGLFDASIGSTPQASTPYRGR